MNHLDFNLQSGVILNNNSPIAVYSRHQNTLVVKKDYSTIQVGEDTILDYVLSEGILQGKDKVKIIPTTSLSISYMESNNYELTPM